MTVDYRSVNQMGNLIAIMNGGTQPLGNSSLETPEQPVNTVDPGVAAMRRILECYEGNHAAQALETAAKTLVRESEMDMPLRDAMHTMETEDGVRMGDWEIRVKNEGKRKFYDVVRYLSTGVVSGTIVESGEVIAEDLTLYEAAYGIARELSRGRPITTTVRDILIAEGEYSSALHDAIHFKHSLTKYNTNQTARAVLEDRYDAAKDRAIKAKRRVEKIVGHLPF